MYHDEMEKVIKLYINEGPKIKVEDDVEFELINVDEIRKVLKDVSSKIPSPSFIFDIKYKLTIRGRDYFGKTICNSNTGFTHEFDPSSPMIAKVTNWDLGENNPNPDIEITINK